MQLAVTTIFRTFRQERSCRRTVQALLRMGLQLPARRYSRPVRWNPPTVYNLLAILRNPHYTGRYVYRQQVCDAARGYSPRGYPRVRRGTADEQRIVDAHHAPYVSQAEWEEIQTILRTNGFSADRRNLGPGSALCQGILRCARHPQRIIPVRYKSPAGASGRPHAYACQGDYARGGARCAWVPGRAFDHVVATHVLRRVAPPAVAALREAFDALQHQRLEATRLDTSLLERARRRATDLEQRFMLVNPTNRLVADHLETQLEEAKREVQRLERDGAARLPTHPQLSAQDFAELERLAADVHGLFYAQATRDRDRKELVRLLVRQMMLEPVSREAVRVTIVWADDTAPTPLEIPTARGLCQTIQHLYAEGLTPNAIAARLNASGLVTRHTTAWTADAVRDALRSRRPATACSFCTRTRPTPTARHTPHRRCER